MKVDENVDRGGWGTEGTQCGGAPDQIISWGDQLLLLDGTLQLMLILNF